MSPMRVPPMAFAFPVLALTVAMSAPGAASAGDAAKRPNIVFILADDLGYGDLGCYGQKKIKTPNLDRLAARGMRFTQFYAGSTVCAPSRCVLMTGKHTGHATIRGNALIPLEANEVTVARLLKSLGYSTGLVGKWGLGEAGSVGVPNRQGFDYFFGYLNQVHAHNSYPDFLWRNEEKVPIAGNVVAKGIASKKAVHSQDLFMKEALDFLDKSKSGPFFLYWAVTLPHANNERGSAEGNGLEVPSDEPYTNEPWSQTAKNYAAMVTYLDRDVGRLLAKLRELGIEDNTLVIFTSDNGPHREGGNDPSFFNSSGGLRGIKRSLHEGGIRVPMIACWPGKIPAGSTSTHIAGFQDFLPTAVEVAGGKSPDKIDGISFLPALLGKANQKEHDHLYWEFYEGGFQQGARAGKWKAVRPLGGKLELYDLDKDLAEKTDIAGEHPEIVVRMEAMLHNSHVVSPLWPVTKGKAKK
jgi:arylsulfatase A-like enzyme